VKHHRLKNIEEPGVITTGYLSLIVDAPSASADALTEIVTQAGGRISSRSDYSPVDFGSPSAYLEVRIPYDGLDALVTAISELGVVQESSVNTYDVSLQKVDLDARLEVLQSAKDRLATLLEQAETISDVVAIETALADRQAELDSLTAQREYLSDQTLFATISVNFSTRQALCQRARRLCRRPGARVGQHSCLHRWNRGVGGDSRTLARGRGGGNRHHSGNPQDSTTQHVENSRF